jgi:D-3-phosphoglycerate dehydrogenase
VIAYDMFPNNNPVQINIAGHGSIDVIVPNVSMEGLLSEADLITLHVPKQDDGTAVLGTAELAKAKAGVILVNTARGGSIDEEALLAALKSGHVKAAALDVFENEPTPREDLLSHPNLSLTPHIGAATVEAQDRIGLELADRILEIVK